MNFVSIVGMYYDKYGRHFNLEYFILMISEGRIKIKDEEELFYVSDVQYYSETTSDLSASNQ